MKKIRHYLRFTLLMAMLLAIAPPAVAEDLFVVEIDGIYYDLYYTGEEENAVGTYAVCWGANNENITTANIQSSVSDTLIWFEYIMGDWVSRSRNITAPVTKINLGAFENCTSLTSVTIPNSVTHIGENAFCGCSSLKSVTIPDSVTEIGHSTFLDCTSLTSVTIPNSVTEIGDWAFKNCTSLTSVKIPNSVTEIGSCTFENCTSLASVTIPNSVTEIGSSAFENCTSLASVTIPNSVTKIGRWAFEGCTSLMSVTIPNSVTEIENSTFSSCTSLTSVTIPNSVTKIGSMAFADCSSLTSVTIPNSVTEIGAYAFWDCTGLRDIYSLIMNPVSVELGSGVFYRIPKESCVLHVPPGTEELYRNADQWKDFFIEPSEIVEMKTAYSKGFANSVEFLANEPKGVTADGASRMYIYFDEDISSVKSVTKKIKIDGQDVTDPAIVGNFGVFKELPWTLGSGKWGFDYCAPEAFPADFFLRNKYEISLEVVVVDNNNKEWHGYKTITVMRPGVLLLHGLFGDDGAFGAQYKHLTTVGGYESYQVLNASYEESNAQSFDDNTYVNNVVDNRLKALFNDFAEHGIISSKYDIVGHSMGGILARLYAQEVNPDAVNRIITLDTPHHGSPLANGIDYVNDILISTVNNLEIAEELEEEHLEWSWSIKVTKKACLKLIDLFSDPKYGAIQNLQPTSDAIAHLNSKTCVGIPVHAIGSYIEPPLNPFANAGPNNLAASWSLSQGTVFLFKFSCDVEDCCYSIMKDFYGGNNDGIVSLTSQLGGLTATSFATENHSEHKGVCGVLSNAFHTKTHHWAKTIDDITGLLKRPKTDFCFTTNGFRAPTNTLLANSQPTVDSHPEFSVAPETSFVNLVLEKNDDRVISTTVTKSDNIENCLVFACLDEDKFLVSACDTDPTFVIPDNYEGNLVFYALGRTANDELVADMDSVEYTSITSLVALDFEDYDDLTMCVGQTLGLNVIATWDNGESEYVKPTYSATPGGILSIDGQMFTPVAEGECDLIAEYKGFTCTKKITVISGGVDPVEPLWGDVNLDGEVNIADINAVINIILMDATSGMNGDVNGDGEVNIADVNAILSAILSK